MRGAGEKAVHVPTTHTAALPFVLVVSGQRGRLDPRRGRGLLAISPCRCAALGVLAAHLHLAATAFHAAPAPAPILTAVVEEPAATVRILTDLDTPRIAGREQLDCRARHGPEQ